MRNIVNISLPSDLDGTIERLVKKGKYASKSEFLRELIRDRAQEEELFVVIEKSRKEIASGKGKELQSLRELRS